MASNVDISFVDWGIWLTYVAVITILLLIYRWNKSQSYYRFFLAGFYLKVIAGVAYVFIYNYYYGDGDTFDYYRGSNVLAQTMTENPVQYVRLLFSENANLPPDLWYFEQHINYSRGSEEWFMVKFLSPINLISFSSYLVLTLFMSLISFWGGWKLFLVFRQIIPQREDLAFFAVFLIPSTLFWGSGIMKDTLTLAAMNYVIYCLYFVVFKKSKNSLLIVGAIAGGYFVFLLKGYIIIAFLPGLLFGINELIKLEIRNKMIKRSLGFVLILVSAVLLYIGPNFLRSTSEKYTVESIESRVKGFHSWHTDMGGSTYNLGTIEYTTQGVIQKIPAAINVTFFRPYLWESRNPVVLIAALESLAILILCITVIYKLGFKILPLLKAQPILYTFLIYSLIFGFIVGFTSYNFGALARYKIPMFSLFAFILIYLNYHGNINMHKRRFTTLKKEENANETE